ncbi:hypothetical protein Taro_028901 [Colocasia esculenta]|uniref:Uncharacterized protein n=1 Tax=Colocasia esculenta TaxID=4460 RepID=A0A843VMF3_COLES|nr:hypothetical protein [Colocasia esculenta]
MRLTPTPFRHVIDIPCEATARSREAESDQARYRLTGLNNKDRYRAAEQGSEMADRRDWGGGGDEPEETTHQLIERLWESITEIQTRLDQQAPQIVEETVPVAPPPPPSGVEVPPVVPVLPTVPARPASVEEPTELGERFLLLQPPTYSGGPNPDIA